MSQQQSKNYLFFSNNCQYSKKLLQALQNTQLLQGIALVNIDDPRVNIPPFIQCVPTLYISTTRHVLTEEHLSDWIGSHLRQELESKGNINIADITGDASILPFQISEMGNGLAGAAYSFIDDSKNDLMNQNYSFLQDRDINRLPEFTRHDATPPSSSQQSMAGPAQRKTGGTVDKAYEKLMQDRGNEMRRSAPAVPDFSQPFKM